MEAATIPTSADIVVAGGGPAGATVARLLARFGYRVVLFEKRRFPRHQIGESLTPQILPILDFLGVRAEVEAAGFLRMVGHTVCWGDPTPRTSYYSPDRSRRGFQAWRADFDALLLTHARAGGVRVVEGAAVDSVELRSGAGVTVRYAPHSRLDAAFFLDASGHAGVLARHGLRQRDPLYQTLALTAYWQGAGGPPGVDFANTLLETYANGLVWSVPLHNGLRNVTFLVDRTVGARLRKEGLRQFYTSQLSQVPYVSGLLTAARLAGSVSAFDATWYTAAAFAGDRFLLVGDAGLFVDPLSSEGVHKAMASAISAVAVVNTILKRPGMSGHAVRFYEESQRLTYETHYRQSARYYREERRWPACPFWQKRSQVQAEVSSFKFQVSSAEDPGIYTPPSPPPTSQRVSSLSVAPGVVVEPRPVIEGPFVELREAVVAPRYPRGVRVLQDVHVPALLHLVRERSAVGEVIAAYAQTPHGQRCTPEAVRQVLARLVYEGVLEAVS